MYNLFLDDERLPEKISWITLPSIGWTIVRNYNDFVKIIQEKGCPNIVSFDHDLADEHYRASMYNSDKHYNNYYTDGTFKEKTGYDAAKFLVEYCLNNKVKPEKCFIHTMNPIGLENINSVLKILY